MPQLPVPNLGIGFPVLPARPSRVLAFPGRETEDEVKQHFMHPSAELSIRNIVKLYVIII